ncbi:hypothetical protein BCO71171_05983 [Burkholderia contaminans]|uniref:Uncharacterized protein n=1 Tax=Burkholderia contaminans TaxID=488447 RepID=A0A6P3BC37_9BURK|nr:hypothetical protein BCO71171_05983 [Burkholderia contaminans]
MFAFTGRLLASKPEPGSWIARTSTGRVGTFGSLEHSFAPRGRVAFPSCFVAWVPRFVRCRASVSGHTCLSLSKA